jgi:hypothetical protein
MQREARHIRAAVAGHALSMSLLCPFPGAQTRYQRLLYNFNTLGEGIVARRRNWCSDYPYHIEAERRK